MTARRKAAEPSRARCQAAAALSRGRRSAHHREHPGEIPGQLSIFDALADLARQDQDCADQEATR